MSKSSNSVILAFDFGGTKLMAAALLVSQLEADTPQWLDHRLVFTPDDGTAQFDIETMIGMGRELTAGQTLRSIGVSFGGPVAFDQGLVLLSHHVPGWEDQPLQALLEAEFGVPVRVDNDANVAALGEWRFGAGRGSRHMFYVTVSTGVGGGWILDERPFRGHAGVAGEIGHTAVDPQGSLCLCGKRGCVERLASGPYMAEDLAQLLGKSKHEITGKDVAQMATAGQPEARQILQRGAWGLGVGLGNAANLINPERIVLGGGVTKSGDAWWRWVREAAQATTLPEVTVEIVPAALGDDAPLWGAAALAV